MDRLRVLLAHFATGFGPLGAAQRLVLRLGPARQRVDEVRGGRVDVPLDERAALHVDEQRAALPRRGTRHGRRRRSRAARRSHPPLGEHALGLRATSTRRRGGAAGRCRRRRRASSVVALRARAPLSLADLGRQSRMLRRASSSETMSMRLWSAFDSGTSRRVAPERRRDERGEIVLQRVAGLREPTRRTGLEAHSLISVRAATAVHPAPALEDPGVAERGGLDEVRLRDLREELLDQPSVLHALGRAGPRPSFSPSSA